MLWGGVGGPRDKDRGRALFERAGEMGRTSLFIDGMIFAEDLSGKEVNAYKKARPVLRRLAEAGNPKAQDWTCMLDNIIDKTDYPRADWCRRAVENGYLKTRVEMGMEFAAYPATELERKKGLEMLRRAAADGSEKARCRLALFYAVGPSDHRDPETALRWADGTPRDGSYYAEANLAIAALIRLCRMDDPETRKQGLAELQDLAEDGSRATMLGLSFALLHGIATEIDIIEAFKWLQLSEQRRVMDRWNMLAEPVLPLPYDNLLDHAEMFGSPEVLREAHRRAAEWPLDYLAKKHP